MSVNRLDTTFSALADPTRRAILARLVKGEATVKQLSAPFRMSQPAISRHLKVLESAGLIETRKQAQNRPRKIRAVPMRQAFEWLEDYRSLWQERSHTLDALVNRIRSERNS